MKSALLFLLLSTGFTAQAENYKLDPGHTEIGFSVKHLLISNVKGRFGKFKGTFSYDKAAKTLSDLKIEIDPASISTSEKNRDEHLVSEDFFDVKKYKTVTFKGEKSEFAADGQSLKITGLLKMRDKELPAILDVTINGEAEVEGVKKIAFTATSKINRKDWGINWNKNLDKGGLAVSEEVKILIEGEANLITAKTKEK